MDEGTAEARRVVAALVGGRRLILTGGALRGLTGLASSLRSWGAAGVLLLGLGEGTGSPPPEEVDRFVLRGVQASDLFTLLHGNDRLLADLPPEAEAAIERFDPAREAVVVAGSWTTLESVAGRRVLGSRRGSWAALEDKTRMDELAGIADVPTTPGRVVAATEPALEAAAVELDAGAGTVWAGDASAGINGGGDLVRWMRTGVTRDHADIFTDRCERVRVSTFRDGVPCSIHGFVTPRATVVLRPVEVLSLRRPDGRFFLAGTASWWDPPQADRERMRGTARCIGEALRTRHDYRGAFGIDGVLTAGGFEITELNPRLSSGFHPLGAASPVPFPLLDIALREGARIEHSDALERTLVARTDDHRSGRGYSAWAGGGFTTTTHLRVYSDDESCYPASAADDANATITTGPSPGGGFLALDPDPGTVPVGPSFAPAVATAFEFADERLGTRIGHLIPATSQPAPDLR